MKTISEQFNDRFYKQDKYGIIYSKDGSMPIPKKGYDQLEAIREFVEEKMKEIIDLSDKIEAGGPNSTTKEWIAFKHFRNTLKDKIK